MLFDINTLDYPTQDIWRHRMRGDNSDRCNAGDRTTIAQDHYATPDAFPAPPASLQPNGRLASRSEDCKWYLSADERTNVFIFGPNRVSLIGHIMVENSFLLNGKQAIRPSATETCYELADSNGAFCVHGY